MTDSRFADVIRDAPLQYVSDYVSFIGSDARGRVCFAMDNNRGFDADPPTVKGRPAERLQAEHAYAVLHDERTGWAPLQGVTRYPHPGPDATVLPDSAWFTFTGTPDTGLAVRSSRNDLILYVEPLADRLVGRDTSTLFAMRTAAATLTWRGRTVTGRVIYEGLATTAMNLLSRRTFAGLSGLEFLYLLAGTGPEAGDLYLQKTLGSNALAGLGPQVGFASAPDAPGTADTQLRDLSIVTTGHTVAAGLYRWPTSWTANWATAGADALMPAGRVELRTITRQLVGQYGIAGFAMAVVTGTLTVPDGSTTPLYGFGELLAGGPLLRLLARSRPATTSQ